MTEESFDVLPEDIIMGRAVSPDVIRDLHVVAQLDAGTVERIRQLLLTLHGLVAEGSVKKGVQQCLADSDADVAESIVRTIMNVQSSEITRYTKAIDRWRQSTEDRRELFTDEIFAALHRNLQVLVAEYPSVALIQKANRLLREVGNEFKDVSFFCDMRPVFDEPREKVEGFVVLANMRLLYVSQDGERHVCEVALTEDELAEMMESGQKATAKMEVLRRASAMFTNAGNPKGGA